MKAKSQLLSFVLPIKVTTTLVIALCILANPDATRAQTEVTGAFAGQVVDAATGLPLPGALVKFTNEETLVPSAVKTDSGGKFYKGQLPPGRYKVEVTAPGYRTFSTQANLFITMVRQLPGPIKLERDGTTPAPTPTPLPTTVTTNSPASEARQLQQTEPEVKVWPAKSKRWALIVGVDQYKDAQINPLRGATNDARTLAAALNHYAGFPDDQIILLANDQPEQRQPTRTNILKYLSNLRGSVPKDGLLLVSFAGHGIEREGRSYLLPSDALVSNDIALLEDTAVNVDRMQELIRASGVGQVVLILDNCRNDPSAGRGGADNNMTEAFKNSFNFDLRNHDVQAFVTLYATSVNQRAYEYAEKSQGYFTWTLVEGLKGKAANERGEVTLAGLVNYLQENVPKYVHRDLGADKQQFPYALSGGYRANDLVIAVTSPGAQR